MGIGEAAQGVRDFEPVRALTAGEDGLKVIDAWSWMPGVFCLPPFYAAGAWRRQREAVEELSANRAMKWSRS